LNKPNTRPSFPPALALLVGVLAVSTSSILIRFAQEYVPSLVIATWRMGLASLALIPFAWRYRGELAGLTGRQRVLLVLSGVFLAGHFASWISSLEYTTVASSVVLVTTTPLWVALASPIFLKERLSPTVWLGLFIAMAGGILVGMQDYCEFAGARLTCSSVSDLFAAEGFRGNFMALAGAWFSAGYIVIGRQIRGRMSMLPYTCSVYTVSAVCLLLLTLFTGEQMTGYPPVAYLWLIGLAVLPQLVGHSVFNWALGYLPAAYVAISLLGEPTGTTILAIILLRETPALMEVAGGVLVLLGILMSTYQRHPAGREEVRPA